MNQQNALATRQAGSLLPDPATWRTMTDMADALLKSGLLPEAIKTPQAAVAIIQKGSELGIPPMYALSNIVVIKGKPTANAELMLALIYRDHGDNAIVFTHSDATSCEVAYKRRSWSKAQTYEFTMADAQKASLLGNQTWQKYPAAMLRARCISAVARMAFPDSIGGMHTPEEIGADVDVVDGEVVVVSSHLQGTGSVTAPSGTFVTINADEPQRSVVDLLNDELDSDESAFSDPLATAYDMISSATERRDINAIALHLDTHHLRDDEALMRTYEARWEQVMGRKAPTSTKPSNDAQTALNVG